MVGWGFWLAWGAMSFAVWFSLLVACLVVSLTPGAGAVNTMSSSLLFGWRRSGWTVLGQQLALLVQLVVVAAGLGVVVAGSPALFDVIRFGGAAYLVFLGLRLFMARPVVGEDSAGDPVGRLSGSAGALVSRGFWVNLSNPKAIVFMLAFVPQFVRLDAPQFPQYAVLALTMVLVDVAVMWGGFAVLAGSFRRFSSSYRGQLVLNRVFGSLFVGVAALLALGGH